MNILGLAIASLVYTTVSKKQTGVMQSVTADNYSVLIIAVVMTLVIGFYLYIKPNQDLLSGQ